MHETRACYWYLAVREKLGDVRNSEKINLNFVTITTILTK